MHCKKKRYQESFRSDIARLNRLSKLINNGSKVFGHIFDKVCLLTLILGTLLGIYTVRLKINIYRRIVSLQNKEKGNKFLRQSKRFYLRAKR